MNSEITRSIPISSNDLLSFDKIYFATNNTSQLNNGCYFEPLKSTSTLLSVIELGEFDISEPTKIKGFNISSSGYINDSFAIAVGTDSPEQIVYSMSISEGFGHYTINLFEEANIQYKRFKVFLLVNLKYRSLSIANWLSLVSGSPRATVTEVQDGMSTECRANDASVLEFTDGFYGNSLKIEMKF